MPSSPTVKLLLGFLFFKLQQRDYISVALFSSGFLNFRSHTKSPESDLEPIKGTWLDSREIASAIRMEPDRSNVASKTLWMALRALDDGSLLWQVVRNSQDAALRIIHQPLFMWMRWTEKSLPRVTSAQSRRRKYCR
jgi:hypothetical protein